jgi:Rad3-related DNA helicase
MMVELCSTIPDGVVAFFTSYSYMESIISEWDGMGIMRQLTKSKLVFIETKDVVETTMALDNFRRACDSGRGAVFLSVARGKVRRWFELSSRLYLIFIYHVISHLVFILYQILNRYQKELTLIGIMDVQ